MQREPAEAEQAQMERSLMGRHRLLFLANDAAFYLLPEKVRVAQLQLPKDGARAYGTVYEYRPFRGISVPCG